jgi:hypothetical protein
VLIRGLGSEVGHRSHAGRSTRPLRARSDRPAESTSPSAINSRRATDIFVGDCGSNRVDRCGLGWLQSRPQGDSPGHGGPQRPDHDWYCPTVVSDNIPWAPVPVFARRLVRGDVFGARRGVRHRGRHGQAGAIGVVERLLPICEGRLWNVDRKRWCSHNDRTDFRLSGPTGRRESRFRRKSGNDFCRRKPIRHLVRRQELIATRPKHLEQDKDSVRSLIPDARDPVRPSRPAR